MTKKNISFLCCLFIFSLFFGQSDMDNNQQLIYTYLYSKDYQNAKKLIDSEFMNSGNPSKEIIGYVYLSDYHSLVKEEEKSVQALQKAKEIADLTKKPIDKAYLEYGYARYFEHLRKDVLFIKALNESISIFAHLANNNFILTQLYYLKYKYKAQVLSEKNPRQECMLSNHYALKSKNNLLINYTYSNIGVYYKVKYNETRDRKYLDSANVAYESSFQYGAKIDYSEAKKRSLIVYHLNRGSLDAELFPDDPQKLLQHYNTVLSITKNDDKYKEITAMTYNNIGSYFENQGRSEMAKKNYLLGYQLSKDIEDVNTANRLILLNNLSRIYEDKGEIRKSLVFEREAKDFIKKESDKQYESDTKALEIYYQTKQKDQQITKLQTEKKFAEKLQILSIAIAFLGLSAVLLLVFWFKNKQKIQHQKEELLQSKHQILVMQQEQLQKQNLISTLQLKRNNDFMQELKEKINGKEDLQIEKIFKEENIIVDDFNAIKNMVQEVHPDFLKKLNEVANQKLTNLDLRYASYIYLNMDNQQISNILKADPNTVRITKYRLKQKFRLEKDKDLRNFLQNLDYYA